MSNKAEIVEAVARYVNSGAVIVEEDAVWSGVHECNLVDMLIEMTIVDHMNSRIDPHGHSGMGASILHTIGHRFIQMGIGIATQEELR